MSTPPTIRLLDGNRMPVFGLGLYQTDASPWTVHLVKTAASIGYRLFDTAQLYENEYETGQGIKRSRIPRNQLFITTKVFTPSLHYHEFALDDFVVVFHQLFGCLHQCKWLFQV